MRWLLLLQSTGSRWEGFSSCGLQAVERRLSSCGTWAELFRAMWDLPGPGLEPVSPALAGEFLTAAPPGKSLLLCFRTWSYCRKPVGPPLNFVYISLFLELWIKNRIQARLECVQISSLDFILS